MRRHLTHVPDQRDKRITHMHMTKLKTQNAAGADSAQPVARHAQAPLTRRDIIDHAMEDDERSLCSLHIGWYDFTARGSASTGGMMYGAGVLRGTDTRPAWRGCMLFWMHSAHAACPCAHPHERHLATRVTGLPAWRM